MPDSKVNDFPPITSWTGAEVFYLIQSALDKSSSLATLFSSIPVLANFAGRFGFSGTHDIVANSGAISVTKTITRLTNDQASTVTLPAGTFDGQIKLLILTTATAISTLAGPIGNTTILLTKKGDSAILIYTQSVWWFLGGSATVT